jgi:hypothetical protein
LLVRLLALQRAGTAARAAAAARGAAAAIYYNIYYRPDARSCVLR